VYSRIDKRADVHHDRMVKSYVIPAQVFKTLDPLTRIALTEMYSAIEVLVVRLDC
jgi:hypothetical protein